MAGLVAIPGVLWSGFLIFVQNKLKQGKCVGSVCPDDPSGFNPTPIAGDRKIQVDVK
jgi:hypothetical protein